MEEKRLTDTILIEFHAKYKTETTKEYSFGEQSQEVAFLVIRRIEKNI